MSFCDAMVRLHWQFHATNLIFQVLYCEAVEHTEKAIKQRLFSLACQQLQKLLCCGKPHVWVSLGTGLFQLAKSVEDEQTKAKNLENAEWVLHTLFEISGNTVTSRMVRNQALGH